MGRIAGTQNFFFFKNIEIIEIRFLFVSFHAVNSERYMLMQSTHSLAHRIWHTFFPSTTHGLCTVVL